MTWYFLTLKILPSRCHTHSHTPHTYTPEKLDLPVQLEMAMSFRKLLCIERNPPIAEVVAAGAVPRLVQFLHCGESHELAFEAAWALTNVASGTSEHTRVLIDNGTLLKSTPMSNMCHLTIAAPLNSPTHTFPPPFRTTYPPPTTNTLLLHTTSSSSPTPAHSVCPRAADRVGGIMSSCYSSHTDTWRLDCWCMAQARFLCLWDLQRTRTWTLESSVFGGCPH